MQPCFLWAVCLSPKAHHSSSSGWSILENFLSINKSKPRTVMEKEELFIMVKGDKTKVNGLMLGIKTVREKRILTARSTEQYPNHTREVIKTPSLDVFQP